MQFTNLKTCLRIGQPMNFGPIGGTYCWVNQVLDPDWSDIVRFSLDNPMHIIEHWILFSINGPAWTEEQIASTGYPSLEALANALDRPQESSNVTCAERLKLVISDKSWRRHNRQGLVWMFEAHSIENTGKILSVIYGTKAAFDALERKQSASERS